MNGLQAVSEPAWPATARFLLAARWRWAIVRIVEWTGAGAAIGAVAALPLVAMLVWRGRPIVEATLGLVAIGAAAGATGAFLRRPSVAAVAQRVDEQFGLSDLLSTAWALRESHATVEAGWTATIGALAEARCATLSPSAVLFARLGPRVWSAIGLACALVMTLALMSPGRAVAETAGLRDVQALRAVPVPRPSADADRAAGQSVSSPSRQVDEPKPRTIAHPVDEENAEEVPNNGLKPASALNTGPTNASAPGMAESEELLTTLMRTPNQQNSSESTDSGEVASGGSGSENLHSDRPPGNPAGHTSDSGTPGHPKLGSLETVSADGVKAGAGAAPPVPPQYQDVLEHFHP